MNIGGHGSGDWVETSREKWQNRSRPFNMNHKHVKATWTINMWKNVTTDHDSMISGKHFPNMNCLAVIGYKLQNGDFFVVFLFFFFWVSRQWDNLHLVFNWENISWGPFSFFLFFLFFYFFLFFFVCSFLTEKCKKMIGQRCQNKISFDRLQPEQIKQD